MSDKVENWEDFFNNFAYKPNWEFDYERVIDFDRHRLVITMRVPDSRFVPRAYDHRIPLVPITKVVRLHPWIHEEEAQGFIRWHISDMEDHEIGEWFRYKGELVFDPHKKEKK